MDFNTKAHSVYLLTYHHIVFVTKYRRPVITDEIEDFKTMPLTCAGGLAGRC